MSPPEEYTVHWHNRLRFKALVFFIVLSAFVIAITSTIMNRASDKMTQYTAYEQLSHSSQRVLTALYRRTKVAATLADSLGTVAWQLRDNKIALSQVLPSIISQEENHHLIAGGGVWPEPYAFDAKKVLDSYFWGRDKKGQLIFFDDYNNLEGKGYHHEEWYVPARHLARGGFYWSKSYTDPHSLQPMVTVTSPIFDRSVYVGAATIDLSLDGLQSLLRESTTAFDGYAFAMDRNGRLLSFPYDRVVNPSSGEADIKPLSFSNLSSLVKAFPSLDIVQQRLLEKDETQADEGITALAAELEKSSYQINKKESFGIARHLLSDRLTFSQSVIEAVASDRVLTIDQDNLLKEPALAVMTKMPFTDWYIVTVMPERIAKHSSKELVVNTKAAIVISLFIAVIVAWLLLKRMYVNPLEDLTQQLKDSPDSTGSAHEQHLITTGDKGELGVLAYWFNQRTRELLASKERVKSLAFYDPLTSLPNRRMLQAHLEQELAMVRRTKTFGAIMFLDLDHFKHLNDSLGHDVGDQLLIEVGQRISDCLRKGDVVARLGGDEFVIVLSGYDSSKSDERKIPEIIASKILNCLLEPFLLDGSYYHVTASIGIALFNHDNDDAKNILKYADSAMYHSKAGGRNTYCFFEDDMQVQADHRLRIENDLRAAMDNGELSLVYQPQVTSHGHCRSVEALLRWKHPVEGFISPVEFVAIAEESKLILPLGKWVIENVCKQIKTWEQQGVELNYVAVNISPIQFQQPDFVDNIIKTIRKYYLPPTCLMIEITEGVIIDNPENVIEKILLLKRLGIQVSIDDFGTGYSSLTYLKRLPVNELKIDRSFVQEIENDRSDAVITETIIAMAENFGYQVIAEGVETEEQRQILMHKGCHLFQGYLFSRPLSADQIPDFVKASYLMGECEKLGHQNPSGDLGSKLKH